MISTLTKRPMKKGKALSVLLGSNVGLNENWELLNSNKKLFMKGYINCRKTWVRAIGFLTRVSWTRVLIFQVLSDQAETRISSGLGLVVELKTKIKAEVWMGTSPKWPVLWNVLGRNYESLGKNIFLWKLVTKAMKHKRKFKTLVNFFKYYNGVKNTGSDNFWGCLKHFFKI